MKTFQGHWRCDNTGFEPCLLTPEPQLTCLICWFRLFCAFIGRNDLASQQGMWVTRAPPAESLVISLGWKSNKGSWVQFLFLKRTVALVNHAQTVHQCFFSSLELYCYQEHLSPFDVLYLTYSFVHCVFPNKLSPNSRDFCSILFLEIKAVL